MSFSLFDFPHISDSVLNGQPIQNQPTYGFLTKGNKLDTKNSERSSPNRNVSQVNETFNKSSPIRSYKSNTNQTDKHDSKLETFKSDMNKKTSNTDSMTPKIVCPDFITDNSTIPKTKLPCFRSRTNHLCKSNSKNTEFIDQKSKNTTLSKLHNIDFIDGKSKNTTLSTKLHINDIDAKSKTTTLSIKQNTDESFKKFNIPKLLKKSDSEKESTQENKENKGDLDDLKFLTVLDGRPSNISKINTLITTFVIDSENDTTTSQDMSELDFSFPQELDPFITHNNNPYFDDDEILKHSDERIDATFD